MSKVGHSFARRKPHHRVIIAHGENVRSFTIRPWLVATVGGVFLAFSALYLMATGYLVFRDDLLAASLARQARMQSAYEDRIASLRSDIDRLTSRQLLNQESVEAEVERLLGRQAALDARQDVIAGLSQAVRRAGIKPEEILPADQPAAEAAPTVDPLTTGSLAPDDGYGVTPSLFAELRPTSTSEAALGPVDEMNAVEASLDALARDQVAFVDAVAAGIGQRTDRIAKILRRIGHPAPAGHGAPAGIGGPFVPIAPDADPDTFRTNVEMITTEVERFAAVRRFAAQLPLGTPGGKAPITSGFGARMDPFLGRPAMHTGIDFRAATGTAIRATASGTVITAEYSGGYGNMVEIDHGNGVTTRFGHMSRIDVRPGQVVAEGAVIGLAGSTGRSTGPHIHYEVRVDGSAIDPMRYIKAGRELSSLL